MDLDNLKRKHDIENDNHYSTTASKTSINLQTGEAILFNPETKSEIRVKIMLDSGSSRSYTTDRIKKFLNLLSTNTENVVVSTFGNKRTVNIDQIMPCPCYC